MNSHEAKTSGPSNATKKDLIDQENHKLIHQMKHALSNSKEIESRDWLENSPVCTKVIDLDFNLQYMSHAGISGLKIDNVEEYYGKPYPFHFFPEWSKKSMIENLERVKASGEMISVETTAFDLEGNELWFHSSLTPINDKNGKLDYIMVISTDITKRKNAEKKIKIKNEEILQQNIKYKRLNDELKKANRELIDAREKAEESEKLKSAFLANMSHEIRTPLNSILGFTNLLKTGRNLKTGKQDEFLNYIEMGSNRLLRIISDIVDISKLDSEQLSIDNKMVNLNDVMNNLQHQMSVQIDQQGVSLTFVSGLKDEASNVYLDQIRLVQILSNLIENASKFTSKGTIEFGYIVKGKLLEFYVSDTGIGIDQDQLEAIFDRFRQVDNLMNKPIEGSGLGLSISKELVNLMHGKMWVESKKNQGSTFYFQIPYIKFGEEDVKNTTENNIEIVPNQNVTVLIAEDEPLNFIYLKALLSQYDFNILHAENGEEAVKMAHENEIDMVLMDSKMPYLNGFEATQEIRKTNKTLPIIAQTAFAMPEDKQKALEAGLTDYISKPITKEGMDEILLKYITK